MLQDITLNNNSEVGRKTVNALVHKFYIKPELKYGLFSLTSPVWVHLPRLPCAPPLRIINDVFTLYTTHTDTVIN